MDKRKIIELLNLDLQDEHGAIVQYLGHAYGLGEGEVACEIEAIARDEMRHLDWLAETIVALGGKPSLERGTMNMAGKTVPEWMSNDVGLEQGAIDHYGEHIRAIDDPRVKRLLQRIVADERAHHGKFEHFIEKAKKESLEDVRGNRSDSVARMLNTGIQHEYQVVLQYMFHSYMTRGAEAKKQLEDQAINEMQHLGWLAEELVGSGGSPKIEETKVDQSEKLADMLKADIRAEKETIDDYVKAAGEIDDAGIKQLFNRMKENEKYHVDVFTDLLKEEKGR